MGVCPYTLRLETNYKPTSREALLPQCHTQRRRLQPVLGANRQVCLRRRGQRLRSWAPEPWRPSIKALQTAELRRPLRRRLRRGADEELEGRGSSSSGGIGGTGGGGAGGGGGASGARPALAAAAAGWGARPRGFRKRFRNADFTPCWLDASDEWRRSNIPFTWRATSRAMIEPGEVWGSS